MSTRTPYARLRLTAVAGSALLALALAGCGQKQEAAPAAPAAEQPAPAAAPAPEATPAPAPAESAPAPAEAASAGGTPTAQLSPIAARWVPGRHFTVLSPAQPTSVAPDKVEVVEVFWYGCGHCFHLDPILENWKAKSKPAYVEFARVPVIWNDFTKAHARLFYTMEALGKLDALHMTVFREIHEKGNTLVDRDPARSEQIHRAFLKSHGVTDADFDRTYRSFSVENKLARADQITRRFRVTGVPIMAVNGKFTADVGSAGGEQQLIALVNDLAASERRR